MAIYDLESRKVDFITAFLNGEIEKGYEIWMKAPEGYNTNGLYLRLLKGLYGLKQAARLWMYKLHAWLLKLGFTQSYQDPCIYIRINTETGETFVIGVFVDDLQLLHSKGADVDTFLEDLKTKFKMTDEGEINSYLGITIKRDRRKKIVSLSQNYYIASMLEKFGMGECVPVKTPMETHFKIDHDKESMSTDEIIEMKDTPYSEAIGSLMYLMVSTRPDIAYAISVLSRYSSCPSRRHWKGVKRVFRYLKGTMNLSLQLGGVISDIVPMLIGYADADYGGDLNSRKSTSGYLFKIDKTLGLISWKSMLQRVVAISTVEAELISAKEAVKEAIALRRLLEDLGFVQQWATPIHEDNQGTIALTKNQVRSSRTKHIDIAYNFVYEKVQDHVVELKYIPTKEQIADIFTKALPRETFEKFRDMLGLRKFSGEECKYITELIM